MTSQFQQMFSAFQQQLTNNLGQYGTNRLHDSEDKYNELVTNHTRLQQNCNALKDKYQKQTIELLSLKNNTEHLSDRVDDLSQCKSKTMQLDKAIVELKTLKNIQPLRDFSRSKRLILKLMF